MGGRYKKNGRGFSWGAHAIVYCQVIPIRTINLALNLAIYYCWLLRYFSSKQKKVNSISSGIASYGSDENISRRARNTRRAQHPPPAFPLFPLQNFPPPQSSNDGEARFGGGEEDLDSALLSCARAHRTHAEVGIRTQRWPSAVGWRRLRRRTISPSAWGARARCRGARCVVGRWRRLAPPPGVMDPAGSPMSRAAAR